LGALLLITFVALLLREQLHPLRPHTILYLYHTANGKEYCFVVLEATSPHKFERETA